MIDVASDSYSCGVMVGIIGILVLEMIGILLCCWIMDRNKKNQHYDPLPAKCPKCCTRSYSHKVQYEPERDMLGVVCDKCECYFAVDTCKSEGN